ncbi:hypothetical protein P775_12075 [Puniceibacterium antarcticum]|uniref:Uncharacterized protein n=1 Tax=Puniceibacterium antarcticum TaxID=1206336 RepID=A0A2G8REC2_9RHOB|nr:hypothetical protein P775_12075 [Puniceibacterium antarcticum]
MQVWGEVLRHNLRPVFELIGWELTTIIARTMKAKYSAWVDADIRSPKEHRARGQAKLSANFHATAIAPKFFDKLRTRSQQATAICSYDQYII